MQAQWASKTKKNCYKKLAALVVWHYSRGTLAHFHSQGLNYMVWRPYQVGYFQNNKQKYHLKCSEWIFNALIFLSFIRNLSTLFIMLWAYFEVGQAALLTWCHYYLHTSLYNSFKQLLDVSFLNIMPPSISINIWEAIVKIQWNINNPISKQFQEVHVYVSHLKTAAVSAWSPRLDSNLKLFF